VKRRALAYFDTSALAKRYVREEGSSRVRALLRRNRVLSSSIISVELTSAFSRRQVEGDLSPKELDALLAQIRKDRLHWELVEATRLVLDRAEELVERSTLRTLDAIHLASALSVEMEAGMRFDFVTADVRQAEYAERSGLTVVRVAEGE